MRCARCVLALSASKWIGRERLAAACCPVPWVSCLFLPSTAELCLLLWVGSNPKITIASQIAAVSPGCWGWPFKQRYHTSSAPSQASHPRDSENYSSTIYQLHRKSNLRSGAGICPSFCDVLPFGGKKKNSLAPPQLPSSSWTSWSGSSAQWSWGFSAGAHDREVSGLPRVQLTHASEQHQLHWETVIRANDPGYRKQLFLLITAQKAMRRTLQLKEVGNFRSVLGNPPNKACLGYQGNVLVI